MAISTSTTSTSIDELEQPLDLENFSVDQIATGEPLDWAKVAAFDDLNAGQVVRHEGNLYLFGSTGGSLWSANPIDVWRSSNGGRSWEPTGPVPEPVFWVDQIVSTPQGLMLATPTDSGLTIWRSDDAVTWQSEHLEVDGGSEHAMVFPTHVAGDSETTIVVGTVQSNIAPLIEERLTAFRPDIDLARFDWGYEDQGGELARVTVQGPFGIEMLSVTPEELGLTDEQLRLMEVRFSETARRVWVDHPEFGWRQDALESITHVDSIWFDESGVVVSGSGPLGWVNLVSEDGLGWRELELEDAQAQDVVRWDDRFVGLGPGLEVGVSTDGSTWNWSGLNEHFPYQFGWNAWPLAAGEAGIVLAAEGWRPDGIPEPALPETPVVLESEEAVLRIFPSSGEFELTVDGHVYDGQIHADEAPKVIEVDLDANQVRFNDLETAETLATFSIDQLMAADRSHSPPSVGGQTFHALAFSPDAEEWTIQDVDDVFGEGTRVVSLTVTDDTVIALLGSWTRGSGQETGFEIWAAPVP